MPLPENSAAANLQLLQNFLKDHTNQQALLSKWESHGNSHQLAICFSFPPEFTINLHQVKQGSPYGERVMRLCESVNQPDTIKADIWTRSPNNGTLSGVRPGIMVEGDPIAPEHFLGKLQYTLVAYVFPGQKVGGSPTIGWLDHVLIPPSGSLSQKILGGVEASKAFLGVPIIESPAVPKGQTFVMNPDDLTKMGDILLDPIPPLPKKKPVKKPVKKPPTF